MALLVIFMIADGIVMGRMPSGMLQNRLFDLHRSVGVLLLILTLVRLGVRFRGPLPAHDLPAWQRLAAGVTHLLLYAILLVSPLLGWVASSAYGAPVTLFWLFNLPALTAPDQVLAGKLFQVHENLGLLMAGLVTLHIGAALFHHFIRGDRVLARMLHG